MPTILEDYFDFSDPEEIRLRDCRVWLHHVLNEYVHQSKTLDDLCSQFDMLSKEQILACLLYYHHHQVAMDRYLTELRNEFQRQRDKARQKQGDWLGDLRRRKAAGDRGSTPQKESA